MKLRDWQERFLKTLDACVAHDRRDVLLVASPGAGKTTAAGAAAQRLRGRLPRVIVVCPTRALRRQWADSLHRFGISLDDTYDNRGLLRAGFHGVSVTYSAVAASPDLYRMMCDSSTLVICDEIHHGGERRTWGEGLTRAFEHAGLRLCLSGTPFRSDGTPIPFVRYNERRMCEADFRYDYAQAVNDGVCRPVSFTFHGGDTAWRYNGEDFSANFADALNAEDAARRRRVAVAAHTVFTAEVLQEAHERLMLLRAGRTSDAGGLVICEDQEQAKEMAQALERVCGTQPVLVISEDPQATRKLDAFRSDSASPWVVAVRMISEGVDIPRLAVLVYATPWVAPLFFRQAVGRVIRRRPGEPRSLHAAVFLPADPELQTLAEEMESELEHHLGEEQMAVETVRGIIGRVKPQFEALSATPDDAGVVISGQHYDPQLVARAREIVADDPSMDMESVLKTLAGLGVSGGEQLNRATAPAGTLTGLSDARRLELLRSRRKELVGEIFLLRQALGVNDAEYARINWEANRAAGIQGSAKGASLAQTERVIRWMENERQRLLDLKAAKSRPAELRVEDAEARWAVRQAAMRRSRV